MKSKYRILLVDDDTDMTETVSDILQEMNFHVEIANNGFEAIERIKTSAFDLVLMDMKMPGINGAETFREIKKIQPEIIVMFMTAQSIEQVLGEILEEGAYGVMYKPIDPEKLVEFIEKTKSGALILFVDVDLRETRKLIETLKAIGYRVLETNNGDEAIKLVQNMNFDMVFIDVIMPVINGLETYNVLREIKPDIKIIMMINYREGIEDLIRQNIFGNVYTCIYKPFDVKEVMQLLKQVMLEKIKGAGEGGLACQKK
jgi:two-component system, NtrC family, response regulator HydG